MPDRWMTIPVGKKLWFYTGGQNGYYLMNDGTDFAIYDHDNHELFSLNYARTPTIQGDVALATATPPQEFNLPLAEGMSVGYPCTYYKNQFNEVKIVGAAKGNLSDGVLLATLPEGFRPSGACDRPVLFTISGSSFGGTLNVSTNGEIRCFMLQRNATDVYFEMSFLAAG